MRPIDANSLTTDLKKYYPDSALEGIESKTLFKQILHDIDNAPTIPLPDFKEGYKQAILDGKTNYSKPEDWCENCAFAKFTDDVAKKLEEL